MLVYKGGRSVKGNFTILLLRFLTVCDSVNTLVEFFGSGLKSRFGTDGLPTATLV